MAQRVQNKAKRATIGRASANDSPAVGKSASLGERCRMLEAERDRLKVELETAKAEIQRLEQARADIANRIDWVIDSLHNILEGGR